MEKISLFADKKQAKAALERLCDTVNNPPQWVPKASIERFKELVLARRAAASWQEFKAEYPSIKGVLEDRMRVGFDGEDAELRLSVGRPFHKPGAAEAFAGLVKDLDLRDTRGRLVPPVIADTYALDLFVRFITNPYRDKFAGPCKRPGCGKFFYKWRSDKLHCSSKCHSAHTATTRTMKRYKDMCKEKIKFVEVARDGYVPSKCRPINRWRKWVAEDATALMQLSGNPSVDQRLVITPRFITCNKIAPPKGAQ